MSFAEFFTQHAKHYSVRLLSYSVFNYKPSKRSQIEPSIGFL